MRQLGQGGMGAVYEAVHERLGSRAAIKVLLPELALDQEMVTRFFNEARAVNLVKHPGIVTIFELGQLDDGTVFIVMEFLEGQTLTEHLLHLASRPLTDALAICRQIASALQAAHHKGVIHRDLKPDNVVLIPDRDMPGGQRVKVLDFGVAKIAENRDQNSLRTRTGIVLGTPRYMAPEQCRGVGGLTDKVDVYSLGVMLYQLLAGRPPFLAEGLGDLIMQQMSEPPPPLRRLEPGVPEAVAALVHEMLAKRPEDRPTMAAVARRLEALEADPGGAALRGGPSLPVTPSMFIDDLPSGLRGPAPLSKPGPAAGRGPERQERRTDGREEPPEVPPGLTPEYTASAPPSLLRRGRGGERAIFLLLALLVVGAAAGYRSLRQPATPAAPPAPPPSRDGEAALLLLGADGDLQARRWDDALAKAEQALSLGGLSPTTRGLALQRKERAEKERRALDLFRRFGAALESKDLDQAMQLYGQIPADSAYRAEAKAPYEKAFPAFAQAHLRRARAAREAGRCAEATAQVDVVLQVEPAYPAAKREKGQPCGEEDADEGDDEDDQGEAPTRLPRAPE